MCRHGADAGVDAGASDARVDAAAPDTGLDGRTMRSCGNGILEPNQGEKCDDGNTNNGDGCNAICQNRSRAGSGPNPRTGVHKPVAPMLVMQDRSATVVMALSKRERSVIAGMDTVVVL